MMLEGSLSYSQEAAARPYLTQINPFLILQPNFLEIHFDINFPRTVVFFELFGTKVCIPMRAVCFADLILLDFIILIVCNVWEVQIIRGGTSSYATLSVLLFLFPPAQMHSAHWLWETIFMSIQYQYKYSSVCFNLDICRYETGDENMLNSVVIERHPFVEIIDPYCVVIAPTAHAGDVPVESNPITSTGIEHCVFFKTRRAFYGVASVSPLIWTPS
jgi:hypothetical protein